jgi:hypothetical protein
MLHLRIDQFDRLTPKRRVGMKDNHPAPFPGKWPTRIAWHYKVAGGPDESYVGKPTAQAVQRYQALVRQRDLLVRLTYVMEFDRKHIPIYYWSQTSPMQINPTIYGVYHFWQNPAPVAGHLALQSFRRRLGGFPVYSPYRALSTERKRSWAAFMRTNVPGIGLQPFLEGE